jgi:hypothetical protein
MGRLPAVLGLSILGLAAPAGATIDVELGQLYLLQSWGRVGEYPDGVSGFSATTTACNAGDEIVPWNGPMAETHPFIGLAVFRERDGILEMVGKSWVKHGFYALSFDQCSFGCTPSDGTYLGIGCSDTYTASHNANRYDLGPREEVNPYTGEWEACGSFFDAEPADCLRDYFGAEPNGVNHRLEVHDADLGLLNADGTKARYFYEGAYYVAGDEVPENSIGWRECQSTWNDGVWLMETEGEELTPALGPVVLSWGDANVTEQVAPDDGEVMLSWQVRDLGDGSWHYEYALYNRRSARGVRSFSVPAGTANAWNIGFHDVDRDPLTDWSVSTAGARVTWETDDWATDPEAPYLPYQTLFNFRFVADRPPAPSVVECGIFQPGSGTTFLLDAVAPDGATPAPLLAARDATVLAVIEPNPFAGSGRIRFSLDRREAARLCVLDVRGRTVRVLFDDVAAPGWTAVRWDGMDGAGRRAASGIYFFRLESAGVRRTVKGVLLW